MTSYKSVSCFDVAELLQVRHVPCVLTRLLQDFVRRKRGSFLQSESKLRSVSPKPQGLRKGESQASKQLAKEFAEFVRDSDVS